MVATRRCELTAHTVDLRVARASTSHLMLPNTLITTRFAARGAQLWIGARLLTGAVLKLAGGDPLHLDVSSALLIVAVCIALGLADVHRRHERALLDNLGVSPLARSALFAIPALIGESAVACVASIIR